jgi:hypothetical protein
MRGKIMFTQVQWPALNMVSALYLFTIYVSSTSHFSTFSIQHSTTTVTTERRRPYYYSFSLPLSTSCHLLPPLPPLCLTTTWHLKQRECQGGWWPRPVMVPLLFFFLLYLLFLLLGMYSGITPTINVNSIHNLDCYVTKRPTVRVSFFLLFFKFIIVISRYVQRAAPMVNV